MFCYQRITVKKSSQICTEHKSCEIDPVKLKESENLETNRVRGRAERLCAVALVTLVANRVVCNRLLASAGKSSPLCRPHLRRHHHLWGPLPHRHVRHLLLFERVCRHPLPRYRKQSHWVFCVKTSLSSDSKNAIDLKECKRKLNIVKKRITRCLYAFALLLSSHEHETFI